MQHSRHWIRTDKMVLPGFTTAEYDALLSDQRLVSFRLGNARQD